MVNPIAQWVDFGHFGIRSLTIIGMGVHWGILQYVLGLPFAAFIAQLIYLKKKDKHYLKIARTLIKATAIVFAVGAATGTLVEFGLIVVWPRVLTAVGQWLYFSMYSEVFAFIMEVLIIYLLYWAWNKIGDVPRAILTFFAFIGPWYSGAMILAVNAYMQVPTGLLPDYNATTGQWLYSLGYPKILLDVPKQYVSLLNITTLQSLGMTIKDPTTNGVLVYMPSKIINRLTYEALNGYTVNQSILKAVLKTSYQHNPAILSTPVLAIVNGIMTATVRHWGYMTILFESPDYASTFLHSIGAGLVVSGFTMMAGYGLRYIKAKDPDYKKYLEKGFKFSTIFSLILIAYEGFIAGDQQARVIFRYQPEKFAAVEGTLKGFNSVSKMLHFEKMEAYLEYLNPKAHLPQYSQIPKLWGQLGPYGVGVNNYRPPLLVDWTYFAMVISGFAIGIFAIIVTLYIIARKTDLLTKGGHKVWIYLTIPAVILAHFASFMGWATTEIGRLPWVVYGVMTINTAASINTPPLWVDVVGNIFFFLIAGGVMYMAYRFLWKPSKIERIEV
ncbi:MAG: cytochrome ubiquinol oxidase subunit I [Caldisphaeraceae archaeon]|nr:cytochrome ubiquinol oxidase subunit I [Caldisphaeraceae archaeon]